MDAIRIAPAVIYLGPSLPRDLVEAALPGVDIRPPVRRGALYRDRQLRYSLFIVIDGVFFQDEALSPREVLDVLADGAVVLGASSMGALRAAELWPAGMRGVGAIYRLYRRGALVADDEVAVVFDPERPWPPLTTALVDIRSALRRARRTGQLTAAAVERLMRCAAALPFAERTWDAIASAVPGLSKQTMDGLATHSLKARDALALLADVRRLVARDPTVLRRQRTTTAPFSRVDDTREAVHDPLASINGATEVREFRRWLVATGRDALGSSREAQGEASARCDVGTSLPRGVEESAVMRYVALRDAVAAARDRQLVPLARHRQAAEQALARAHGAVDWQALLATSRVPRASLGEACHAMALAKAWRERQFARPTSGRSAWEDGT